MTHTWDPDHRTFLDDHLWAVLATGRADGSPQQSMIGYAVDDDGRLLISAKSYTAKWKNALRQPRVSVTVPDGRAHLVIYGDAEAIDADPPRGGAHRTDLRRDVRHRAGRPRHARRHPERAATHRPANHAREDDVHGLIAVTTTLEPTPRDVADRVVAPQGWTPDRQT